MADKPTPEPLRECAEVQSILEDIAILGGLEDDQLAKVFAKLQKVSYPRNAFIFEKGDSPSSIYIVLKGRVRLMLDIGGEFLEKITFGVGECFGETTVIGIQAHTATVMAAEDTELILLPRSALFSFYEEDKDIFCMLVLNIAREACRRLNKTDEILLRYFAHQT